MCANYEPVTLQEFERAGLVGRHGLLPPWADQLAMGRKTCHCRSEAAATQPSFREAWQRDRRCIIAAERLYQRCDEKRMPAILNLDDFDAWLACPRERAMDFIRPYPADPLAAYPAPLARKPAATKVRAKPQSDDLFS